MFLFIRRACEPCKMSFQFEWVKTEWTSLGKWPVCPFCGGHLYQLDDRVKLK